MTYNVFSGTLNPTHFTSGQFCSGRAAHCKIGTIGRELRKNG